jgi:hypothetical protein
MDQLNALNLTSVDEIQKVLFFRKMPTGRTPLPIAVSRPSAASDLSSNLRSPAPGPSRGEGYCFHHACFRLRAQKRENGCIYQENEEAGGGSPHRRRRPHSHLLTPTTVPASATAMSFLPAKNLIFLQDTHNNFKFFLLIPALHCPFCHPLARTWWWQTTRPFPRRGFRRFNIEFNFLIAAVATPLFGMDFLTHFGLSIIPSKQQILHAALGTVEL